MTTSLGTSVTRFVCGGALAMGLVFSMLSPTVMASSGPKSLTQWEPIAWRECMRTTANYYDWIWEANNHPDPGVDYGSIIDSAKREMDSACNRVSIENNLPPVR